MNKKNTIAWADFEKVRISVGTIVEAREVPEARKPAYRLTIDFGPLGILQSSAQITALYDRGELPGRQVVAVTNFPPKKIAGFASQCLVLGVVRSGGDVVLLQPERPVPNGSRIA